MNISSGYNPPDPAIRGLKLAPHAAPNEPAAQPDQVNLSGSVRRADRLAPAKMGPLKFKGKDDHTAVRVAGTVAGGVTGALVGALGSQTLTGFDRSNMDLSVDPKVDFFHYAIGNYLKAHPIPPSDSSGGIDAELCLRVQQQLKGILEDAATHPQNEDDRRLGDFFQSGMNLESRESAGLGPVAGLLDEIGQISSLPQLQTQLARLNKQGINPLFDFGSGQDAKDQSQVIGQAFQGGLGLPDRDYYTGTDDDSRDLREKYRQHILRSFQLAGQDEATATRSADAVLRLETRLAETSLTQVELRDPAATYNPMDRAKLAQLTPHFDWGRYFGDLGRPDLNSINVSTPKFFQGLDRALSQEPLQDWKAYFSWTVLRNTASILTQGFRDEDFSFQKELTGAQTPQPLWQAMVAQTDNLLGDSLGRRFVAAYFPPEAKQKAEEMAQNVISALRDRIPKLDWMGPETGAQALDKLNKMRVKIGYPERWKDYGALQFDRAEFAGNVLRAKGFQVAEDLARIGAPVDKNRWLMTPSTVNAYYDPPNNEFVLPAAFLQPPYFDLKQDDALNYGITACTIGHEMTHGFDDQGAQYDADGNLRDWFTKEDKAKFERLTDGVAAQFGEFKFEDIPVNGKLVEGESVADLGGVEVAFLAFQKARQKARALGQEEPVGSDGFTPEQRFFLGFAESWAWNVRPELAKEMLATNPHPLPQFRVLGSLANVPEFLDAFSIPPGSPMYRPVEKRNRLWGSSGPLAAPR